MKKTLAKMNSLSSKLWYDKRWVSKTGEASLYLQVVINGKHKEFNLKLKWPVDKIDNANGTLLPRTKGDPDVYDYNLLIMMEKAKHTEILRTYRIKKIAIDLDILTKEVRVYTGNNNFVNYMYRQIITRYAKKEICKRTMQTHNSCSMLMVEYNDTWPIAQLTLKWMKDFKQFLINKGYMPGHIWSVIKTVKTYLQIGLKEPMIHIEKEVADFPNPEPIWTTTYLNNDDLAKLLKLYKFGEISPAQKQVLRAFLFTCFTSLRISDVYRVNSSWRMDEQTLFFLPKKGEKWQRWIKVPITPMALQFVKNTIGTFFELPSEVQYNAILKEIAKAAGIHKRLTSHVGRHTYGYLYMKTLGNTTKGLQEILGHVDEHTTQRYAHIDEQYKIDSVMRMQAEFPDLMLENVQLMPRP